MKIMRGFFLFVATCFLQHVSGQLFIGGIPNTICPLGPFAIRSAEISGPLFSGLLLGLLGKLWRRKYRRTCIDTTKGKRCFYTYVPACAGENSALVYDIHALISCPAYASYYTGWKELAEEQCFVLVWPTGNVRITRTNIPCWSVPGDLSGIDDSNPGYETDPCCCRQGDRAVLETETDDLGFLRLVASYVVRDVPKKSNDKVTINTKRIYMAGHSNGCFTAFAMAMKHSDLVASVCCHSGVLLTAPSVDYIPTPIWFVHGTADGTIAYNGTEFMALDGTMRWSPSIQSMFDYLTKLNGCTESNTTTTVEGNIQYANNCTDSASVELMSLSNVGHIPFKGIDTEFDTTSAAWNFCSSQESLVEPTLDPI